MIHIKLFENFEYDNDELIKYISSNSDAHLLLNNKVKDYMTFKDFSLIYQNIILKFSKIFNLKIKEFEGLDPIKNIDFKIYFNERDPNIEDFEKNKFPTIRWQFNLNNSILVTKYDDDWWLVAIDSPYFHIHNSERNIFGSVLIFLCDTRDALLGITDWLIRNRYLNFT